MPFYERRLAEVHATWDRIGGDVVGALRAHERAGSIELMTTTATHAYLPGLLPAPASIRAQLRLGLRGFAALSGGARPRGLWLPECAYDPRLGPDLAAAGVRYTILDAHGLELASPRPPSGVLAPVLGPGGVAYFARDPAAARDVWSRQMGYPGDPVYREFYRDVGFDLPEDELLGEVGPGGARLMTGLKPYRITGPGPHKEPYDPALALDRAREHARHFVDKREAMAAAAPSQRRPADPGRPLRRRALRSLVVRGARLPRAGAPFAPRLGARGRRLRRHARRLPRALSRDPRRRARRVVLGRGWLRPGVDGPRGGPAVAPRAPRREGRPRRRRPPPPRGGLAGQALDQAIRELLLLQASDWAFMIKRGEMAPYAEARVRTHAQRAARLVTLSQGAGVSPEDAAWVGAVCDRDRFLIGLEGEAIRDAFDPW